ncbi:hypothetical protein GF324_07285 [bacterium]|nr:hypothetical protein [bacterium]
MPIRDETHNHARYLTFGCYHKRHLFKFTALSDLFVQHLDHWRKEYDLELWAYVIMANHVHLLVYPKEKKLGPAIGALKSKFAREAPAWLRDNTPALHEELSTTERGTTVYRFWQTGGGYDRNVFSNEAIQKYIRYMHNNPVRAGVTQHPEAYVSSSARFWLRCEPVPMKMDVPAWWREGRRMKKS